jgi:hypothetical protein
LGSALSGVTPNARSKFRHVLLRQATVLTNQNGAVLTLTGEQAGLIGSLDLSGLALSPR